MKKIIYILFITIAFGCNQGKNSTEQEKQKEASSSVVVNWIDLSKIINLSDLQHLNPKDLRLLRNEIFARRGYKFTSQELDQYFRKFDWYNPKLNQEQIDAALTEIDRNNIRLIIEMESKLSLDSQDSDFIGYLKLIPKISLPLSFVCEEGFPIADLDHRDELVKKFNPKGATIIGKLYESDNGVGIIYGYPADIFYPVLTKFDYKGNKIADMHFFELRDCVGDAGYIATTSGTISKDLILKTRTERVEWDFENEQSPKDTTILESEIQLN